MGKNYEKPEVSFITFEKADIITDSVLIPETEGPGPSIDAGDILNGLSSTQNYN